MDLLESKQIVTMIQRALNEVDERLVNHGIRVALLVNAMLKLEGVKDEEKRKNLCILALLHDIGAYKTEEIDRMVAFETDSIWEHSIYGYLILREFTPLKEWGKVILYHHAGYEQFTGESQEIMHYAYIFHVADRVDVFWSYDGYRDEESLHRLLEEKSGTAFSPEAVALFWRANHKFHLLERLYKGITLDDVFDSSAISAEEAKIYLQLLVFSIDFRSRYTVNHTVNTMHISGQLAKLMGLMPDQVEKIYFGALLHDIGKIGTPLSILEKPGKLSLEEMEIMRRHVGLTEKIIRGCVDEEAAKIALRHHEKLDGSGYPEGLTASDLTLGERIVAVADIISALCGTRSYKEAFPKEKALRILDEMRRQGQLDGQVVDKAVAEFDTIIEEAQKAGAHLIEIYDSIANQYHELLNRFRQTV